MSQPNVILAKFFFSVPDSCYLTQFIVVISITHSIGISTIHKLTILTPSIVIKAIRKLTILTPSIGINTLCRLSILTSLIRINTIRKFTILTPSIGVNDIRKLTILTHLKTKQYRCNDFSRRLNSGTSYKSCNVFERW